MVLILVHLLRAHKVKQAQPIQETGAARRVAQHIAMVDEKALASQGGQQRIGNDLHAQFLLHIAVEPDIVVAGEPIDGDARIGHRGTE